MPRSRVISFKEDHLLEYGLEIASRNSTTKEVDSVRCKFCIPFGKEGASTAARKNFRMDGDVLVVEDFNI